MKKIKAKYLLKPYFLIPACIIFITALAFVLWYLMPKKTLSVAVIDKTVPATAADSWSYLDDVSNNYRKHIGLYWIMDYLKIVNPETGRYYDHTSDYYGPKLNEANEITESSSISEIKEIPDLLYLSDAYGVEIYDDRGINEEEMNAISLCHSSGSVIVGEQDILTTGTDDKVRNELEKLFGISSTGWVGRYIYDLQDLTDVPYWAPDMWRAKYGQEWNCAGAGILLVSSAGDIIVLEEKTDFQSENLLKISVSEEYRKEFGKHSLNYYNWFELIEADNSTEVIATYNFNVNSTGAEELAAVSDTTTFAAITRCVKENEAPAYYFAGDFNDYTTKRQISNFMFADKFFQLLSFDRDGDITHFYWNFYQPIMKKILKDTVKNPVEPDEYEEGQIARVTQDGFEIKQDDSWQPFEIKGFNINGEAPGGKRYEYSRDYSFYSELLQTAANAGANCIRTYDLLPPEFYRALCEYNGNADSVLYLIQGIMTPPDTDPAKSFENIDSIKQNVASAIAAVHGEGSLRDDDAVYSYNASPYVISYIIDPRLGGESSDAILAGENAGADYSGKYISASGNGAEALAAELCDYALQCMQSDYGCMQPVSAVSSAERLEGAEWLTEGMRGFNFSNMQLSDGVEGLYYTSVSLNPDDRQLIDNEAAFAEMYSDSSGKFAWGGYIGQVRKLYNGPVLIDKAGLSTSSDVFEQESSVNGLSETEQGEGIVRMLKAADEQGYAGMLIADLNDNWSAVSEQSEQYTIPASDSGLWQDTTVRAETTGIVAVDSVQPQESAIQLNDNGEKSIMSQMQLSYNETYVYITLLLKNDIDYDKNEMIIGIDTYQRNDGEYYYDSNYYANSQSGMEYIVKFESKNSASLYVASGYNRNTGNYVSKESYSADYDLVSVLNYGNFTSSNTHFYQTGVTVRIRLPWAMLNFANPSSALVINGNSGSTLKTTATDGMIFSVLVGSKDTMDTAYIFPESKQSAGYKRLELAGWEKEDINYTLREKESAKIIQRYFSRTE